MEICCSLSRLKDVCWACIYRDDVGDSPTPAFDSSVSLTSPAVNYKQTSDVKHVSADRNLR